jgi:hypothetical protein
MGWRESVAALLGISTYEAPPSALPTIGDKTIEEVRKAFGGNLYPLSITKLKWYLADLESAQGAADNGELQSAALLCQAFLGDGVLAGLMSTRTDGLVRLPKRFYGDPRMCEALEGRRGARSVFDDMCPKSELALLAKDGIDLGVGIAELVPVKGRNFPVLVRLDPQHLVYRWNESRWYYNSIVGLLPITPGDGRWVLHTPAGRVAPWRNSLWRALGQAWIDKSHARLHRANWEAKLANPARVAVSPQGATSGQRTGMLEQLIAWGINQCFELPPGWDVKIVESNGIGAKSFGETIDRSEREMMIAIAGQTVTTDGGAGFANGDIHKSIRSDLIDSTAEGLAHTVNTQVLPQWVVAHFGIDALDVMSIIAWDTKPPKDLKADGEALKTFGEALGAANEALQVYGMRIDARELATQQGVPLQKIDGAPLDDTKPLPPQNEPQDQTEARAAVMATVHELRSVLERIERVRIAA